MGRGGERILRWWSSATFTLQWRLFERVGTTFVDNGEGQNRMDCCFLILSGLTIDMLTRTQGVKRMYLKYISKSIYHIYTNQFI